MTTLVIPDIHNDTAGADAITASVPHDRVVYLGDYFDDFHDTPADARNVALWLEARTAEKNENVFLFGNHDIHYLWGVHACSGYTSGKFRAVAEAIKATSVRERMKFHTWVDGWLLSHAGLTAPLCKSSDVKLFLGRVTRECRDSLDYGEEHWLTSAGRDRGGWRNYGGITWCDFQTLQPIAGVKQLVGHTPGATVRNTGADAVCIDTRLRHYAVIEEGRLTVFEAKTGTAYLLHESRL